MCAFLLDAGGAIEVKGVCTCGIGMSDRIIKCTVMDGYSYLYLTCYVLERRPEYIHFVKRSWPFAAIV